MSKYVVLDTNCLLQSISSKSKYYKIWEKYIEGEYYICVTTEILEEYEEIIASHTSPVVAKIVLETICGAFNTIKIDAHFKFNLIEADYDENKFVDCAITSNAEFIVTNDKHFNILKKIGFPKVYIKTIEEFYSEL